MSPSRLGSESHHALAVLAENPDGYTRVVMLARGVPLTASLIRAGLAADEVPKRRGPGPRLVARVRITDAGRLALAEHETTSLVTLASGVLSSATANGARTIRGRPRGPDRRPHPPHEQHSPGTVALDANHWGHLAGWPTSDDRGQCGNIAPG
jgi:hypothetical protein